MNIETYRKRREKLMRRMGEGVAIIPNAPSRRRNSDVDYPHRAHSNFLYLTDFPEVKAVIVLIAGEHQRSILFCAGGTQMKRDKFYMGAVVDPKAAVEQYGFDEAYPINEMDERTVKLLQNCPELFYSIADETDWDSRIHAWIDDTRYNLQGRNERAVRKITDLHNLLAEMRLIKSKEEITQMRIVAGVSAEAHVLAMENCFPGMWEYELEALMTYHLRKQGADPLGAYSPIVAGGVNTCTLHYAANNCVLYDGDLALVDFGGEYHGYSADITRTFPVNGRFSPEQRNVYEIVLAAQKAGINEVRAGNLSDAPHKVAQRILIEGLVNLGLMKGNVEKLVARRLHPDCLYDEPARIHTLHMTGHWLGLDVHDVGDYAVNGKPRTLVLS